jgi:hypothetical protein
MTKHIQRKKRKPVQRNTHILDEHAAAEYLNWAPITLRKSRMEGIRKNRIDPPPFVRTGRKIGYLRTDLDAYLERHRIHPQDTLDSTGSLRARK